MTRPHLGLSKFVHPSLIGLAAVAAAAGDTPRAARLLGAVEALTDPIPHIVVRAIYDHALAAVRAKDDQAVSAAWAVGRAMSPEQAIAYALEEDD